MGKFNGNVNDAMRNGDNMKFSTFDRDNDSADFNCAMDWKSGWWYTACFVW
ncbi:hypothetical protein KR215_011042 [Drosophila sulfurigaster]|nr:hypothetical protein KR215_011042 [Drosophila sulfurigaster]